MAEFVFQMIKARKSYGDRVILDDVTLSFLPGAKIGVETTEPAHMQRRKKFRKKRHFCRTMDLKIPIPHLEPAFPELRDPQSFLLSVSVHAMHSASLKRKSHKLHGTGEK